MSNMYEQEALVNVLMKKGIITKAVVLKKLKRLKTQEAKTIGSK